MSTRYTAGPWYWLEYRSRDGYSGLFSEVDDEPVLYPQRENDGDDGDAWFGTDEDYYGETALRDADASLIASAPELLEALEAILKVNGADFNGWHGAFDDAIALARKAIKKARGEP